MAPSDRPLHGGQLAARPLNEAGDEVPIDPQRMCREVRDWLRTAENLILIGGGGGDNVATAAKIIPVRSEGAWGQMMRPQSAIYGWDRLEGVLLNRKRYEKGVEPLGGHGDYVTESPQLRPALERAAASGLPALVNVEIRQDREYAGGIHV